MREFTALPFSVGYFFAVLFSGTAKAAVTACSFV